MAGRRLPPPRSTNRPDAALAIVNIVLLLIFFFLATGSLLNSDSVEIELPLTTELPLDRLPKPLLYIDADGQMTLDSDPVATGELNALLIDSPLLHVLADRDLSAGRLLEILDGENLIAVEVKLVTLHNNVAVVGGGI